jgi:hypothetical protein
VFAHAHGCFLSVALTVGGPCGAESSQPSPPLGSRSIERPALAGAGPGARPFRTAASPAGRIRRRDTSNPGIMVQRLVNTLDLRAARPACELGKTGDFGAASEESAASFQAGRQRAPAPPRLLDNPAAGNAWDLRCRMLR